jgi:putative polyhydroxyalkanoate system protein
MSDINLVKSHALSITKAKALVQKAADGLASEYDLESEWHGNTLRFHRSGVDGEMLVTDSKIELDVTLGLLMKPFKAKFVDRIERDLDKLLAKKEKGSPAKKPGKKKTRTG